MHNRNGKFSTSLNIKEMEDTDAGKIYICQKLITQYLKYYVAFWLLYNNGNDNDNNNNNISRSSGSSWAIAPLKLALTTAVTTFILTTTSTYPPLPQPPPQPSLTWLLTPTQTNTSPPSIPPDKALVKQERVLLIQRDPLVWTSPIYINWDWDQDETRGQVDSSHGNPFELASKFEHAPTWQKSTQVNTSW